MNKIAVMLSFFLNVFFTVLILLCFTKSYDLIMSSKYGTFCRNLSNGTTKLVFKVLSGFRKESIFTSKIMCPDFALSWTDIDKNKPLYMVIQDNFLSRTDSMIQVVSNLKIFEFSRSIWTNLPCWISEWKRNKIHCGGQTM